MIGLGERGSRSHPEDYGGDEEPGLHPPGEASHNRSLLCLLADSIFLVMSLSPFGCAQDERTKSYQCGDLFVLSLPKHEREWGGKTP